MSKCEECVHYEVCEWTYYEDPDKCSEFQPKVKPCEECIKSFYEPNFGFNKITVSDNREKIYYNDNNFCPKCGTRIEVKE